MKEFAEKVIETGRSHLRKQRRDYLILDPKIGIPYNKKMFQKIKENLEFINGYGKVYKIRICELAPKEDGSGDVYFERISV